MEKEDLTIEDATQFLKNMLGIKEHESMDRFELLSQIMCKYLEKIPFHNITVMASTEKRVHTVAEVIQCVEMGYGGLCYDLNVYLHLLLQALG